MNKRLLVATLAVAALAPLAAHAGGGVTVSVSTPEFGFRIGAPFYGAPVFGPVPVYAPAPVFVPPPVFVPQQVIVVPARVIHRAPVVVVPRRVVYAPVFVPPPCATVTVIGSRSATACLPDTRSTTTATGVTSSADLPLCLSPH